MSMAFTVDNVHDEFVRLTNLGIKIIDEPTMRPWGAKKYAILRSGRKLCCFSKFS